MRPAAVEEVSLDSSPSRLATIATVTSTMAAGVYSPSRRWIAKPSDTAATVKQIAAGIGKPTVRRRRGEYATAELEPFANGFMVSAFAPASRPRYSGGGQGGGLHE